MAFIERGVAEFFHGVRSTDPTYVELYRKEKGYCRIIQVMALAATVCSVALGIFGLVAACTGAAAAAIPSLLIAISLGYVGYNGYKIFSNAAEIFNRPAAYQTMGVGPFNPDRIREKLAEGTLFCRWFTDELTDILLTTTQP